MANQQKKIVLLIVEDEAGFRRIYRDIFLHEGYSVLEAENGEAGLTSACDNKPNLILLDLVLPKMDGFEVLEKVRANPETKNIPVILFSVMGRDEDIKKGIGAGANDYIVKGLYSPREVLAKISSLYSQWTVQ